MSIETHIYTTLTADASLIAEVPADRIYHGEAAQTDLKPYIVCRVLGRTTYPVLSGKPSLDRFRVQLSSYAGSPLDARTVAELVLDAIEETENGTLQFERTTRDPLGRDYGIQQEFFIHLNRGS